MGRCNGSRHGVSRVNTSLLARSWSSPSLVVAKRSNTRSKGRKCATSFWLCSSDAASMLVPTAARHVTASSHPLSEVSVCSIPAGTRVQSSRDSATDNAGVAAASLVAMAPTTPALRSDAATPPDATNSEALRLASACINASVEVINAPSSFWGRPEQHANTRSRGGE